VISRRQWGQIWLFSFVRAPAVCGANPVIRGALERLYNFDFAGANRALEDHIARQPADPLGYCFRAASLLFQELDRLRILEGEFFADDKRVIDKSRLPADPKLRNDFFAWITMARDRARQRLDHDPQELDALFTMCITAGLVTDYVGLIERRQLRSLEHAKESHQYAVRLLRLDPTFTDAYMTTGLTEYLLGSVPFFVRWFLRFPDAQGDKSLAERNLLKVVDSGRYLGPFAKILLCIIYLREKRPKDCQRLLSELARDYPENALLRKELAKVTALLADRQ